MLHSRPDVECLQFDVTFETTLEREKLFLRNRMKTKLFFRVALCESTTEKNPVGQEKETSHGTIHPST